MLDWKVGVCTALSSVTVLWNSDLRCSEKQSPILACYGTPH